MYKNFQTFCKGLKGLCLAHDWVTTNRWRFKWNQRTSIEKEHTQGQRLDKENAHTSNRKRNKNNQINLYVITSNNSDLLKNLEHGPGEPEE